MLPFELFYLSKNSIYQSKMSYCFRKTIISTTICNIDNTNTNDSPNWHFRMISERSCDTEDCSNGCWKFRFPFKLSRDITEITPLWETPSLQPFLKTYWLTPVNDWPIVAKHANMTSSRGSINAAPATIRQNLFLHFAEPRLWLKMLQLTVKVRSFEGRPHGCSSAAFRWVWHFLR